LCLNNVKARTFLGRRRGGLGVLLRMCLQRRRASRYAQFSVLIDSACPDLLGLLCKRNPDPDRGVVSHVGRSYIPEIASVSECLSARAPNWVDRWDFNRSTCWSDESSALAAVPAASLPRFRLYCYRLFPVLFGASGEPWLLAPVLQRDGGEDTRQSILSAGRTRQRFCDRNALRS